MVNRNSVIIRKTFFASALAGLVGLGACGDDDNGRNLPTPQETTYARTDLVSNESGQTAVTDPNLVNPWGIAAGPDNELWVANNGSGTATLYDLNGIPQPEGNPLVVTIPPPVGSSDAFGAPTGIVRNEKGSFEIGTDNNREKSKMLFATEQGTILGWSDDFDPTTAVIAIDNSTSGAIYKGLANGKAEDQVIYATDFHNGIVAVYDENFLPAKGLVEQPFVDPDIPDGFAPFGIQRIGDVVYVTYAATDADGVESVAGAGLGYVSAFDQDGAFVARVASEGTLNAPWSVVETRGMLLVGNFGDGLVSAFDSDTFEFIGLLQDDRGFEVQIDGLWGLITGESLGRSDLLFFTSGPDAESNGMFGALEPLTN